MLGLPALVSSLGPLASSVWASRLKCCAGSNGALAGPPFGANSTAGQRPTIMACVAPRRNRKTAGSGWPTCAEATSAPTISQDPASRWTSRSSMRPRARAARSTSAISACISTGTDSFSPAAWLPAEIGHVAMRCSCTRRPPTRISPSLVPHSKTTCRSRSTPSTSHWSMERNSMFWESRPLLPARSFAGTKLGSATPAAWSRSRSCCASSFACSI
mmetsp:Transcript_17815/g.56983  ORF Transcript_17815/g.56983 Transcript_17815/m.56983 type:complete len:216 (+) Transcript_17815:41-688(+)